MSDAVVVRYRTTPETADENQRLIEAVFAELATTRPAGLQYLSIRLEDGVSFVHIARGQRVLPGVAAFQEFQRDIPARVMAAPEALGGTVIGSYQS